MNNRTRAGVVVFAIALVALRAGQVRAASADDDRAADPGTGVRASPAPRQRRRAESYASRTFSPRGPFGPWPISKVTA